MEMFFTFPLSLTMFLQEDETISNITLETRNTDGSQFPQQISETGGTAALLCWRNNSVFLLCDPQQEFDTKLEKI